MNHFLAILYVLRSNLKEIKNHLSGNLRKMLEWPTENFYGSQS